MYRVVVQSRRKVLFIYVKYFAINNCFVIRMKAYYPKIALESLPNAVDCNICNLKRLL